MGQTCRYRRIFVGNFTYQVCEVGVAGLEFRLGCELFYTPFKLSRFWCVSQAWWAIFRVVLGGNLKLYTYKYRGDIIVL